MAKLFDLAVVVGSYQQGGETKFKWKTVGALIEGKGNKQYIMLDRTFNPAGVPDMEGRGGDQIVMSLFEPKERSSAPAPQRSAGNSQPRKSHFPEELDDDIPF